MVTLEMIRMNILNQIDGAFLEHNLIRRFAYLCEFMDFGDSDVQSIHQMEVGLVALDAQ